jgi:DNA-binding transcriptional ArsR family regulator
MTNVMDIEMDFEALQANAVQAESFLKQIANANRLMILCSLLDEELSVGALNELVPLSQSALSQHLAKLREAGFVRARRDAQTVYYRIGDDRVRRLLPVFYEMFCQ